MADRIYTQADYDKVTDLYNEYQTKKDSYTPEQQQQIENAFWNARATMSNRIIESNNRVVDMWNDEQWNSWQMYWDGRKEMVNAAPTPQPAPTQQKATRRTPEVPANNDEELYWLWWYLKEDTLAWEQQKNNSEQPEYITWPITWRQFKKGPNPNFTWNSIIPNNLTIPEQPEYITWPITWKQFKRGSNPNFTWNSIIPNNLTIPEQSNSTERNQWLLAGQWFENAQDRLAKYSPQFQADIKRILASWWTISNDGFVHRADWSVVTKI